MSNIIVVGGGPAGMMAAIISARNKNKVTLIEHNEKLGKKLFITGKGRCNVTNHSTIEQHLDQMISNPKFMYSAIHGFDAYQTMEFFEQLGVRLKVERGNRVFPQSDHSSDIIRALEFELRRLEVNIKLSTNVKELLVEPFSVENNKQEERIKGDPKYKKKAKKNPMRYCCKGVILQEGKTLFADAVILATGGVSYPLTGADKSGLEMAKKVGMNVTQLYPALVPLRTKESWGHELMGLALKNVSATIKQEKKILYEGFGELLFTHNGVSGPLILSASSLITKKLKENNAQLFIDLKPALSNEQLDKRLLRDFESMQNKSIKNAMTGILPARLITPVLALAGIEEEKKINRITKQERLDLVYALKHLELTIIQTADFNEAIITQGGISVKDINSTTMESKVVKDLFLAGECIDVDSLTGGYNLQIAWSTGVAAGMHAGN